MITLIDIKMNKQVAINFGDNDFEGDVQHFLEVLKHHLKFYNKEQIVKAFNELAPSLHYATCLNYSNHNIKTYLKISEDNVFLDDEVKKRIETHGGCFDHSFHVIDYTIDPPYRYSL